MSKGAHGDKRLVADRLVRDDDGDIAQIDAGSGQIATLDGEKVAVSRTTDGSLHAVSAVCSHLRCIVSWNDAEHSWDCPCHGSRFAHPPVPCYTGPATKPLEDKSDLIT